MSTEEIKNLEWNDGEKFGLVNIETKQFFLTSDNKQSCLDAKARMTPAHPKYHKLELVENPNI